MSSVLIKDAVVPLDMKPEFKLEIKIEKESDDEMKSDVDGSYALIKGIDIVPVEFEHAVPNANCIEGWYPTSTKEKDYQFLDEPKKLNAEIKVKNTDHFQIEIKEITKEENVQKPSENYQNSCTPLTCSICKLECVSTSQLKIHLRVHTGEKPYSCSLCAYTTSQKGNLVGHLKTHTKEKPFSCQMCEFRSKAKDTLNRHILRVHGKEIKPAKHLKTKVKLKNNKNTSTNYSCATCNLKFTTKTKLTTHTRTHTEEKRYPCPFCEYKYARKKDVETHIIQNHNDDKPYACPKCGYKCKLKNYLLRHVCIHSGMKTFSCSSCEFKTKDLRSLDIHMIIHGGRKPYSCKSCHKKFTTWSALERHSASIQDGTRITNGVECGVDED